MKKYILLVFAAVALTSSAQAQLSKKMAKDTIIWSSASALTPDLFQAKRSKGSGGYTSAGILFYTNEKNGNMIYHVEAFFLKSKSFLKDSSIYIMRHEQLHFNISELNARRLRQRIIARDFAKVKNIRQEIQRMYDKTAAETQRDQDKYDRETENGLNAVKQKMWSDTIAKQLEELKQFESTEIDIANK